MNISITLMAEILIGFDPETNDPTTGNASFDFEEEIPSRAEMAAALIHKTQGRIFGATVLGRNGKIRNFNAKITEDSFNAHDQKNNQVTVFENNAHHAGRGAFRTIALEGVKSLSIDGRIHDLDAIYGPLSEPARMVKSTNGLSYTLRRINDDGTLDVTFTAENGTAYDYYNCSPSDFVNPPSA